MIIYHKFVHGYVDLQFEKLGDHANDFIKHFQQEIEDHMTIQRAGKSAVVIRIHVPKINPHHFFEDIRNDVLKGQDAAKRLLDWFQANQDLWIAFHSHSIN